MDLHSLIFVSLKNKYKLVLAVKMKLFLQTFFLHLPWPLPLPWLPDSCSQSQWWAPKRHRPRWIKKTWHAWNFAARKRWLLWKWNVSKKYKERISQGQAAFQPSQFPNFTTSIQKNIAKKHTQKRTKKVPWKFNDCGGFLKWWVSPTNPWGFPTKNHHFGGVKWGVPPFKETPMYVLLK